MCPDYSSTPIRAQRATGAAVTERRLLADRAAVVVGGSRGIGRAVSELLASLRRHRGGQRPRPRRRPMTLRRRSLAKADAPSPYAGSPADEATADALIETLRARVRPDRHPGQLRGHCRTPRARRSWTPRPPNSPSSSTHTCGPSSRPAAPQRRGWRSSAAGRSSTPARSRFSATTAALDIRRERAPSTASPWRSPGNSKSTACGRTSSAPAPRLGCPADRSMRPTSTTCIGGACSTTHDQAGCAATRRRPSTRHRSTPTSPVTWPPTSPAKSSSRQAVSWVGSSDPTQTLLGYRDHTDSPPWSITELHQLVRKRGHDADAHCLRRQSGAHVDAEPARGAERVQRGAVR